jgi:hypothetical protein
MRLLNRYTLVLGLAGAMVGLPLASAAQDDRDDARAVQEAIRFEKAKQAAADRQARIEDRRERESNSADRAVAEPHHASRAVRKPRTDPASKEQPAPWQVVPPQH